MFSTLFIFLILSLKPFEYYTVETRIPNIWKKKKVSEQNGVMFERENKSVVLLSFGKEHYYFKYPTLFMVFQKRDISREYVERFVRNVFTNVILPQSERDRKKEWKFMGVKKAKSSHGYEIEYYSFYGKALRPVSRYIPMSAQAVVIKGDKGSCMIVSGFAIANISAFSNKKLSLIQNGFVSHMNDVLSVANNIKFVSLKRDDGFKKYLIRKKHFRHESSFSSGFSTGMYSNSVTGHRKIYFDFYRDGTCRFIDNGVISGMFNTTYGGENLQSGHSLNTEGTNKWSRRMSFDIYHGKNGEYLVVHFPEDEGGDRIFSITKKGKEKCGKKSVTGLAIDGKVEGYFLTQGGVCTYKK